MTRDFFIAAIASAFVTCFPNAVLADTAAEISEKSKAALASLVASNEGAKAIADEAVATLSFADIVKAGFLVGGQHGEGALFKNNEAVAYYRSAAASYGLQVGIQKFGYVLFFMNEGALEYLDTSDGWEIGIGPSLVVVDEGTARTLTSTTARSDIYAFIFGQEGLMAGLGIQGTKMSSIDPD